MTQRPSRHPFPCFVCGELVELRAWLCEQCRQLYNEFRPERIYERMRAACHAGDKAEHFHLLRVLSWIVEAKK